MREVNISPPLSLARFFLTQQLIYKSKIEKHNVRHFRIRHQYSQKPSSAWTGEKTISYIRTHIQLLDHILVSVLLKSQRTFEDQGLIIEIKNTCIDQRLGK